jgi:hypothetical protein
MHAKLRLEILKEIENFRDEGTDAEVILRGIQGQIELAALIKKDK